MLCYHGELQLLELHVAFHARFVSRDEDIVLKARQLRQKE